MKTGRELLLDFPTSAVRLAWAKETIRQFGRDHLEFILKHDMVDFGYMVAGSFDWSKSKKGHDFWAKISGICRTIN